MSELDVEQRIICHKETKCEGAIIEMDWVPLQGYKCIIILTVVNGELEKMTIPAVKFGEWENVVA